MAKRAIGVDNQLGRALLLKWFQYAGRFPQRKQEIPSAVVQFLARQLEVSPDVFHEFPWKGRSIERQRAKIRQYLGVREGRFWSNWTKLYARENQGFWGLIVPKKQ